MLLRDESKDLAQAEILLTRACSAKVALGCGALGSLYGLRGDSKRARRQLEQGCTMGDPLSCDSLGGLESEVSQGGTRAASRESRRKAAAYYRRACDLGSGRGCAFAAAAIGDGIVAGAPKDALVLYVKACSRGLGVACRLGVDLAAKESSLASHYDVPAICAELLRRGCEAGDAICCARLSADRK